MNAKMKAEEFFWMMLNCRKSLTEIPQNCSQGETGVLVYLAFMQDRITPSELSEKLNVSLPRIASVLNSLEFKELIIKEIDNEDKRKTIVAITQNGKEFVSNKKDEAINNLTLVLERLDEEEINEYIRITKKIVNIFEEIHN